LFWANAEFTGPMQIEAASSHKAAHNPPAKLITRYDIVPLLRWAEEKLKAASPKVNLTPVLSPCGHRLSRHCGGGRRK
jgi:hypothetical protein